MEHSQVLLKSINLFQMTKILQVQIPRFNRQSSKCELETWTNIFFIPDSGKLNNKNPSYIQQ